MLVTSPISWPLAKVLDRLLGEESALFRRHELNALISLHAEMQHDGSGAWTAAASQAAQVAGCGVGSWSLEGETKRVHVVWRAVGVEAGGPGSGLWAAVHESAGVTIIMHRLLRQGRSHMLLLSCACAAPAAACTSASSNLHRRRPSRLPLCPAAAAVGALTADEATVIKGALDLANKTAESVMTPLPKVRQGLAGVCLCGCSVCCRSAHSRVLHTRTHTEEAASY